MKNALSPLNKFFKKNTYDAYYIRRCYLEIVKPIISWYVSMLTYLSTEHSSKIEAVIQK